MRYIKGLSPAISSSFLAVSLSGLAIAYPAFAMTQNSVQMDGDSGDNDGAEISAEPQPDPAATTPPSDPGDTRPRNASGEVMIIPALPAAPVLSAKGYPECREDWQQLGPPFERAEATNQCTQALDSYYNQVLLPFASEMIAHQTNIAQIFNTEVKGNATLTPEAQQGFYADMRTEYSASEPGGEYMADYRATVARYQEDRAYLQDRFCFNAGCNGYAVPDYIPPEVQLAAAEKDSKKDSKKSRNSGNNKGSSSGCGRARKRGGFLGGLVGGIAGQAAGLNGLESLLVAGASSVLVGEIACQLNSEEQEEAIKATEVVTKKEEVGATAEWKSPTRQGVSGSSTVTALVARPNGGKCMTITDIAIIEGEETRVEKRMCRAPGEKAYVLAA